MGSFYDFMNETARKHTITLEKNEKSPLNMKVHSFKTLLL